MRTFTAYTGTRSDPRPHTVRCHRTPSPELVIHRGIGHDGAMFADWIVSHARSGWLVRGGFARRADAAAFAARIAGLAWETIVPGEDPPADLRIAYLAIQDAA